MRSRLRRENRGRATLCFGIESERTDIGDIIALHRRSYLKGDARLSPTPEFTLDQASILQFQRICTAATAARHRETTTPQICLAFITSSPAYSLCYIVFNQTAERYAALRLVILEQFGHRLNAERPLDNPSYAYYCLAEGAI